MSSARSAPSSGACDARTLGLVVWLLGLLLLHGLFLHGVGAVRLVLIPVSAISHAVLYGGLLPLFGASLRPGREALVSRWARRVEPCPTPALLAYTRGVTWLWAGFAATQLAGSVLLLALAPLALWSLFVNVLDLPLVVLVFGLEYACRRWRFRDARLATWRETARAFARRGAA